MVAEVSDVRESAEYKVLRDIFDQLAEDKINYCVLRNYERLPYSTNGSDLDILVESRETERFIGILEQVVALHGGRCIVLYRAGRFFRHCYCTPACVDGWGLQFDIHTGEEYRGLPYFDELYLLHRRSRNGISVTEDGDAAMLALLKDCLSNGRSRKKYIMRAAQAYKEDPPRYSRIFRRYYGNRVAKLWDSLLRSTKGSLDFRYISIITRCAILVHAFGSRPVESFFRKARYHRDRFARIFCPIGFSVAVLGVDGAGKTTVIQGIAPILECALHTRIDYRHLRPGVLPSLSVLFGGTENNGQPVTDPHGSLPAGLIGSMGRIAYYLVDYIVGYWAKVYPVMVRRPSLFIFDRYFYDYMIDPRRMRLSLPRWVFRVFELIVPEPDLILCLGANPEVIHARKSELSLEEVQRQVAELRAFCDWKENAMWIDTGKEVSDSVNEALDHITKTMSERYQG